MSKRKRAGLQEELEDPADLYILIAGRDEPLTAHRGFLSYFSTLVKDLPPCEGGGQATWDLREVILEGDSLPVDDVTVQTWLDITYARLDETRPVSAPSCLRAGLRLLKFADFAGTRKGVLRDIGSRMAQNQDAYLEVAMDEQHKLHLLLHGAVYYQSPTGLRSCVPASGVAREAVVPIDVVRSNIRRFQGAVSAALEAALYLAARLDLTPLVLVLRNFVLNQLSIHPDNAWVLDPGAIYSPRVMLSLPREVLMEAFLERAFTDLPAGVKLHISADVGVELESPIAAYYLNNKMPRERMEGLQIDSSGAGQLLVTPAQLRVRAQMITGGLSSENRQALVRKLLEDTAKDAAA